MKSKLKAFHNENHKRDEHGRIVERDYSTFNAIPCSLCGKPIIGFLSFSKHGKPHIVYGMGAGFTAPLEPITDLGNIDYCEDCHIKLETSAIRLRNKFKNYEFRRKTKRRSYSRTRRTQTKA